MRTAAALLAVLGLPASAQRVVVAPAPVVRPVAVPVVPVSPSFTPSLSAPSLPTAAAPTLASPSAVALPAPAAAGARAAAVIPATARAGVSAASAAPDASSALGAPASAAAEVRPPAAKVLARLRSIPSALRGVARLSFGDVVGALSRAFDGGDTRPAPPVPADPSDRVEFNGIALPRRAFSDESRISAALIAVIDATRETLDIAIHGLELREVAEALSRAKARGVKVRVVMNETHAYPRKPRERRSPEVQRLMDEGFPMRLVRGSREYGVMHNKFLLADGRLLMSGSYNWTRAADTMHLENVFFSEDAHRIEGFQRYWSWMWDFGRPSDRTPPDTPEGPEPPGPPPEDPSRPVRFNGELFPAYAFAPRGTPEPWLAKAIGAARRTLDVAMFSFTSPELKEALAAARARGVKVRLLFDARNAATLDVMKAFIAEGYDVRIRAGRDGVKGVLHDKFAVFDGALVEAGSYNWTENADKNNYENASFFDDPGSARDYGAAYERMWRGAKAPTAEELARWARTGFSEETQPPASGRTDRPSSR